MCCITRKVAEKSSLLRFVVAPDGAIVEDINGKLPGRGRYVTPYRQSVIQLLKRSGVPEAQQSAQLERIAQGLQRRLLASLNLARRAGSLRWGMRALTELVVSVADRAENSPDRGFSPPLLLLAADAAENTMEKFSQQCKKLAMVTASNPKVHELLDRQKFGEVCGGDQVAVLVVQKDGMVGRVLGDIERLQAFLVG